MRLASSMTLMTAFAISACSDTSLPESGLDIGARPDPNGSEETVGAPETVDESTPVAPTRVQIISNFEIATVAPQSVMRLGLEVPPELGGAVRYRWSAVQPLGSVSRFAPSDEDPTPSFEMNVAGSYAFHVQILDADPSSGQVLGSASLFMRAVPVSDLHVSLTWRTPGDPDESDVGAGSDFSAGSDLDLHLLRTNNGRTWFHETDDCYWNNPFPSWAGATSPTATLDRDDTDGAGPENINVAALTSGSLAVGVHYWKEWGYGPAFATVRIYLRGELVEEWSDVELVERDMWHSHNIDGATGAVTRVTIPDSDAPQILPGLEPPGYELY